MPKRPALQRSLTAIARTFGDLEAAIARLTKRIRAAERRIARRSAAGRPARALKLTPKRRAQLKLQGAYMGYMRQLKPGEKARIKALKEKRGFGAAIRAAKKLARP